MIASHFIREFERLYNNSTLGIPYYLKKNIQKENQIPCPADPAGGGPEPFGAQRGSGAAGTGSGSCNSDVIEFYHNLGFDLRETQIMLDAGFFEANIL